MTKFYLLFLPVLLLLGCSGGGEAEETEKPDDNFSVSGTIREAGNTTIYLEALSQQGAISVASAATDANGKFELKGNIPGMGLYQLRLGEAQDRAIPLPVAPKDNIRISTSFTDFAVKPNVSGTDWSATMNEYMALFAQFASSQQELQSMQGKASEDELMKRYMELRKPVDEFSVKKMKEDPASPFNIILSTSVSPNMGFKYWDPKSLDVLKLVAEAYLKKYEGSPIAANMENQVYQIEMAYDEYVANNSGSKLAPEIALKNPQGKVIKLSSLRGNYVLIDFWASWCGPCRQENPNVVRLYNKYKDKGFTIYSVSLDKDAEAWKRAITSDGLVWPNHVSDLLHWNSPMPALYGFNGIPYTVLIDKEGKIIATGLRGPSLEQKLVELLGK
jgi:thiol-disulfide isomerase/thioredoxin